MSWSRGIIGYRRIYVDCVAVTTVTKQAQIFDIDKARGVLVGLAAGDRNLGPIEMALMICESLNECGAFDREDVVNRWLVWWQDGAWDTGRIFDEVMQLIDQGFEAMQAAQSVHEQNGGMTAGCNGAHRAPVLATFQGLADNELDDAVRELTACTHYHEHAVDSAVAVARLCRRLILGESIHAALTKIGDGLNDDIQRHILNALQSPSGTGGYSHATLQSALYFAITRESFTSAIEDSLVFAGPPNYCPVLVGAIAGARWGAESIDENYLDHCKDRSRILAASRLI